MKLPKCPNSKYKKRVKHWQRTFCNTKCFRKAGDYKFGASFNAA
jgi:hypothetical protein